MKRSTIATFALVLLAVTGIGHELHAQSIQPPLARYRMQLERIAGSTYRPWFGSRDSGRTIDRTDSLARWGFDDNVDIYGYDSTLIAFSGGEMLARREGKTRVVIHYPFYPRTIDTVEIALRRDGEGLAATIVHRPIPAPVQTPLQRLRVMQDLKVPPLAPNRPHYRFEIYPGYGKYTGRYYYQSIPYDQYLQSEVRRIARTLHYQTPRRSVGMMVEVVQSPVEVDVPPPPVTLSGYDSTIVRFVGNEVQPIRSGTTPLVIHHLNSVDTVRLDVDPIFVVRVLPTR